MELNSFFYLSILLFVGLLFGGIVKHLKLPNVTGYLIGGLLVGPSVFGIISEGMLTHFDIISEMALGFIAFAIGNEFKSSYFKRVGFTPIVIAITEAFGAVILVSAALIMAGFEIPLSIMLGAIAAATAPAATIMVIRQYKAKGKVTETLLSVVAFDDAVALIAFGFAVTIAKAITFHTSGSILLSMLNSFGEVLLALAIGGALGALSSVPLKWITTQGNRLSIIIAFVFMAISLSVFLNISSLLTCMAMGAVFTNLIKNSEEYMKLTDLITPPIFLLFFAISGAELQLSVIPSIGLIGIIYVIVRVIGKVGGAWFGATIMKADESIKKYLGPTLIPQAGVAIGLSLVAKSVVPGGDGDIIRAVVLCATLIYEIVGPVITKITLEHAGEIEREVKYTKVVLELNKKTV